MSRPAGRVYHAALHLLDRQLRDRAGALCGKVDDLELEQDAVGTWYVSAVLAGPGHLLHRLGRRTAGDWLSTVTAQVQPSTLDDPGRVPYDRVSEIGVTVDLAVDADELATFAVERWTRDHIVGHIPGAATMRISDVLCCHVVDHDGTDLGPVRDVRLVMDGPVRGALAALRLDAVVVGGDAVAGRLGYLRGGVRGPWPLSTLMRRLERRAATYRAPDIASWDLTERRITLVAGARPEDDPDA